MIVIAASRMSSAISLGVFCRLAPSTIAIMRSRNVSPGLAVMRTTSQSDSTRVPPVTLLRSPPLSRITGALSPVMALSSTEATPSITSPSPGQCRRPRPAPHRPSAVAKPASGWCSAAISSASSSCLALTSRRVARSASACALPRPSAIASAKLANSTVNHSQAETPRMNPALLPLLGNGVNAQARGQNAAHVHREHHRIADLPAWIEFQNESVAAARSADRTAACFLLLVYCSVIWAAIIQFTCCQYLQLFHDWPQRQCRHEGQRPHQDNHADQHHHKQRPMSRQRSRPAVCISSRQRSGDRQRRNASQ